MSSSSAALGVSDPVPLHQLILKIASRCNLRCTYCYMYSAQDQSWRRQPVKMSDETVDAVAARLAAHVERHELASIAVVLHGGEPLLAGREYVRSLISKVRARMPGDLQITWGLQTNGVLLDSAWLGTLADLGVHVGVSLDGSAGQHDRHRRDRGGHGTYSRAARALRLLMRPEFAHIYDGLLAVVDLESDPVEAYEALLAFAPPRIDFLLPHGNWSSPPPGMVEGATPYGDWLATAFDRWFLVPRQETVVRLFRDTVLLLLGGKATTTHLGLTPTGFVVVNTDGSFEQDDALRTAHSDGSATGMNVFNHSVEDVLAHPDVRARRGRDYALSDKCRQCKLVSTCGGGNYTHRYRVGSAFRNPSVYCHDLQRYIRHVHAALVSMSPRS